MNRKQKTFEQVKIEAYTEIEGFLQLIVTTEKLSKEEKKAYNRMLRYVRNLANIRHDDL